MEVFVLRPPFHTVGKSRMFFLSFFFILFFCFVFNIWLFLRFQHLVPKMDG